MYSDTNCEVAKWFVWHLILMYKEMMRWKGLVKAEDLKGKKNPPQTSSSNLGCFAFTTAVSGLWSAAVTGPAGPKGTHSQCWALLPSVSPLPAVVLGSLAGLVAGWGRRLPLVHFNAFCGLQWPFNCAWTFLLPPNMTWLLCGSTLMAAAPL